VTKRILRWLAALTLVTLVAGSVYAWTLATPEIGKPTAISSEPSQKLWTFGFVGDTQQGEGIVDRIFARMQDERVEFVLHLGDVVEDADNDEQWRHVLDEAARHDIKLQPVVGNHDILKAQGDRGEICFEKYFPEIPGTFYQFSHRGLSFLMLNSERSFLPGTEQAQFVERQLAEHPGPTVVCLHRPVFTCGPRDWGNQYKRRVFLHGRLAGSDAALVLAGHHHYYDRSLPLDGITYVVSGGGSRKLYAAETPTDQTAKFQAGKNHFGLVDVYPGHLEVRVLDLDLNELDRFAVTLKHESRVVTSIDRREELSSETHPATPANAQSHHDRGEKVSR
jgi:predicted phosphodiesterase